MSDIKEHLSNYVDGNEHDGMLDQIMSDPELRQRWQNYHLVGDVIRNEVPAQINFDIAGQVAAQLELEPTVLAPKPSKQRFAMPAKVVQLSKQFGQYAIAAGVAAVAVVGVQQYGAQNSAVNPSPVLQTTPMLGAPTPASYQVPGMGAQNERTAEESAKEQQIRANAFLRDHLLQQRLNGVVVQH
ncbi:sigma-E factor negative regulatory protein [Ferrimonas lipolytica]|uniref:Anti-sigma-E factor RseA n=1 Tax=Ferrimonas lipolytica TaxID=2724191 RepID=A0A6H1UGQ5_9GAMM|nr:RseA family anti-sigma factor [Ferrimonas lipolytica]QIZ77503.1 anti-sigma factor [Ferrimonas lipolytica]